LADLINVFICTMIFSLPVVSLLIVSCVGIHTISVESQQLAGAEAMCSALHQRWDFRNEGS